VSRKRQDRKARQRAKRLNEADDKPTEDDAPPEGADLSGKSEVEIRQAGMRIDLPFEAPSPKGSMRYSNGKTMDDILRERTPSPYKREDDADSS
jgi:hypothetical protein